MERNDCIQTVLIRKCCVGGGVNFYVTYDLENFTEVIFKVESAAVPGTAEVSYLIDLVNPLLQEIAQCGSNTPPGDFIHSRN